MALAILMFPFVVWWSLTASAGSERDPILRDVDAVVVLVEPGDTLWEIARRLRPDGDHRSLVHQLSRSVGESALKVGDEIRVPADLLG